MSKECSACGSLQTTSFFSLDSVPVYSMALLHSREEALRSPRGSIDLAFCNNCGFIFNQTFRPELLSYDHGYESSQAFSPRFNAFAQDLACGLIRRHGLEGRRVVEIGCGNGDFLALLCSLGAGEGIGIDPAAGTLSGPGAESVRVLRELFRAEHGRLEPALLCCRHTLEHIPDVGGFLSSVADAFSPGTPVFFEVPDTERILRECAFWDVYYEHCSYFTENSLRHLFANVGFEVIETSLAFDDQYLLLHGRIGNGVTARLREAAEVESTAREIQRFASSCREEMASARDRVSRLAAGGRRCIVWGGGSKGVAFLNLLGLESEIDYVVDINPLKQNRYVAGTGHLIASPDRTKDFPPDVVFLMNPIYEKEVAGLLTDRGVRAEILHL